MNGIELIKAERERQIKSEGYTSELVSFIYIMYTKVEDV